MSPAEQVALQPAPPRVIANTSIPLGGKAVVAGHRRGDSGSGAGLEDRLQLVRPFRPVLS